MDSDRPTREQLERRVADLQRRLAESAALSQSVIEQSPIPIAIAKPTGELTYNSACAEQLMFSAEPSFKQGISLFEMKQTWQDYDTDGNPMSVEQLPLARALQGETTKDLEIRVVRKDGSERWELVNAAPVYNDDGELIAGFVSFPDITARKLAEAESKILAAILESTSDMVSTASPDGTITYLNRAGRKLLGWDDVSQTAKRVPEAHPKWAQEIIRDEGFPTAARTGLWQGETALLATDGTEIPVSQVIMAHKSPTGEVEYYSTIIRDISDRKRIEAELRQSEKRHRELVENLPQRIFQKDTQSVYVSCNNNYAEDLGIAADEIVGRTDFDFHPRELAEKYRADDRRLMDAGQIEEIEESYVKDGREIVIQTVKTPLTNDAGQVTGILGIFWDITERKQAEAELRASEEKFRSTINNLLVGVVVHAADSTILLSNPQAHHILGLSADQMRGKKVIDPAWRFVHEDMSAMKVEDYPVSKVMSSGKPLVDHIVGIVKPDRQDTTWANVNAIPIFTQDNQLDRVIVNFIDITDRKQAEAQRDHLEAQLLQAQKMEAVGQLAGGIAHDFNNILTAVQGNAELLKMDLPSECEQATFVGEIIKGASRAADLTKQMLAFARKGKWRVVPVDIHNIITQTAHMLTHSIDRRIEIRLETIAPSSTVMGDPTQLQNAMLNMGLNARDAMTDGGTLTYATRNVTLSQADCDMHPFELTPGEFLEIRIIDTGVGMDAQTQKKIFEPFFTTKSVGKGTGLGLAGTYGCIRNHNGSISVSSEPGKGSTFTTLLPLASCETDTADLPPVTDTPVRGTGCVLIVDDEESVRNFVWTSLENLGYTVSACKDGASAVDHYRLHHQEIDLVILDLIMPVMSGQDAFIAMQKIDPDVRVIVSSGYSRTQTTKQMLDAGALALLNKPFQIMELSEAVAKHIRRRSR